MTFNHLYPWIVQMDGPPARTVAVLCETQERAIHAACLYQAMEDTVPHDSNAPHTAATDPAGVSSAVLLSEVMSSRGILNKEIALQGWAKSGYVILDARDHLSQADIDMDTEVDKALLDGIIDVLGVPKHCKPIYWAKECRKAAECCLTAFLSSSSVIPDATTIGQTLHKMTKVPYPQKSGWYWLRRHVTVSGRVYDKIPANVEKGRGGFYVSTIVGTPVVEDCEWYLLPDGTPEPCRRYDPPELDDFK